MSASYSEDTRNADKTRFTELQFADDTCSSTCYHKSRRLFISTYIEVAADFGLTVSIPKTKLMVTGRKATAEDRASIPVGDYQIECVTEFPYLGSVIASSGRMQPDIDQRIAQASRAFRTLRRPVFSNRDLRVETKRKIHSAGQCSAIGTLEWRPSEKYTLQASVQQ